jgi:hypothetical protein
MPIREYYPGELSYVAIVSVKVPSRLSDKFKVIFGEFSE